MAQTRRRFLSNIAVPGLLVCAAELHRRTEGWAAGLLITPALLAQIRAQ